MPAPEPAPRSVEAVFDSALARPPAEREAFVAEVCGDDEALLAEVRAMLAAHEAAGGFMHETKLMPAEARRELARLKPEEPGERIGPYKLLQQIGEGGFGTVWMAEQTEPVRRRVALKIIKLGMDTRDVVARFEQERQALAMMDHPNIAKVFDGGATQAGRPFFVMELVRGVPITKFCDEHQLSIAERLELFTQVCHAIQHAHQKGIIHRDVKPSNILVTAGDDSAPLPKVIDFGVAKATDHTLTDKTLFTQFGQMIGSPAYMSPEQAGSGPLDIDTRSDIYALGVVLYEMLTGQPPFDPGDLLRAGWEEMRRVIREQEPPRPSTRLSTLTAPALTGLATQRHTEPPRLLSTIRGDLDWIVMKAIEKNRTRRYESASGLAQDVQRYLTGEPITARPPSFGYKAGKFIRKHKGAVTALVQARSNVVDLYSAWGEVEFLSAMLTDVALEPASERDVTLMKEILDNAVARLDRHPQFSIAAGSSLAELGGLRGWENVPRNERITEANLRSTIGESYLRLGLFLEAQKQFERTLSIRAWVLDRADYKSVHSITELAVSYVRQGKASEAKPLFRELAEIKKTLPWSDFDSTPVVLLTEAMTASRAGDHAAEETLYYERMELVKLVAGPDHPATLKAKSDLAFMYELRGEYAKSEPLRLSCVNVTKNRSEITTTAGRTLLRDNLKSLVSLYQAWSKPDEAAKWQQKLDAYDQAAAARPSAPPAPATPEPKR